MQKKRQDSKKDKKDEGLEFNSLQPMEAKCEETK
jgi:hypothetical protein